MEIEKVYYKHYRYPADWSYEKLGMQPYSRRKTKWQPTCKGGRTICYLVLSNDNMVCGYADCSEKDNFSYKIGRQIAYGRAMKRYLKCVSQPQSEWITALSA